MDRYKQIRKNPLGKKNMKVFFKTQLCPNFERGSCTRGRFCNFAHGQHELRSKPNLEKTRMCTKIQEGENCENPNCKYAHDVKELKSTKDYYKTSLCIDFKKGFCKAGELCRYAHGEEDLRTRKVPKRDDTISRESDYQVNVQRRYRQNNIPPQNNHQYYPQQGMVIGRGPPQIPHAIPAYQIPYGGIPQGYYQPQMYPPMRGRIPDQQFKNRFTQNPQMPLPIHQIPKYKEVKTINTNVNNNKPLNEQPEVFLKNQNPEQKPQGVFLEKVSEQKKQDEDKKYDINFLKQKDKEVKEFLKQDDKEIDYNPYFPSQQNESQKDS